jgi:nucleotide-binding universal stress UspA family protein
MSSPDPAPSVPRTGIDVVVGWNDTPAAIAAAEWAADRQEAGGRLHLVRVLTARRAADRVALAAAHTALDEQLTLLRRHHPTVAVSGSIEFGHPSAVLARESFGALLVVGTRVRTGPIHGLAGASAIGIVAAVPAPVLVVPDLLAGDEGGSVIVGVDGSAAGIQAALLAAAEAQRVSRALHIVHAWWDLPDWGTLVPFQPAAVDSLRAAHRVVLDETADLVSARFPAVRVFRALVHAPTLDALVDAARHGSLLVLGRHSRVVGLSALLGSTTRAVLLRTVVRTLVAAEVERVADTARAAVPAPAAAALVAPSG